jgi:hypothetical protein
MKTKVESFAEAPPPALVLLASDGYANSFSTKDAFLQVGSDLHGYLESRGAAWISERVEDWLTQTSADGSGDDITLVLAWNGAEAEAGARDRSAVRKVADDDTLPGTSRAVNLTPSGRRRTDDATLPGRYFVDQIRRGPLGPRRTPRALAGTLETWVRAVRVGGPHPAPADIDGPRAPEVATGSAAPPASRPPLAAGKAMALGSLLLLACLALVVSQLLFSPPPEGTPTAMDSGDGLTALEIVDRGLGVNPYLEEATGLARIGTATDVFQVSDVINAIVYIRAETADARDLPHSVTQRWMLPNAAEPVIIQGTMRFDQGREQVFIRACAPAVSVDPQGSGNPAGLAVLVDERMVAEFQFRVSGGNAQTVLPVAVLECSDDDLPRT